MLSVAVEEDQITYPHSCIFISAGLNWKGPGQHIFFESTIDWHFRVHARTLATRTIREAVGYLRVNAGKPPRVNNWRGGLQNSIVQFLRASWLLNSVPHQEYHSNDIGSWTLCSSRVSRHHRSIWISTSKRLVWRKPTVNGRRLTIVFHIWTQARNKDEPFQ
jgi:hypothetical protein